MRRGLTLIELLISIAGGALILAALLNIFLISREALDRGGPRQELVQNARIALERIARDLRQAEELVTALPPDDSDPLNPPPSELEFQDGHDSGSLTYIRFHLTGQYLYRELAYYAFDSNPGVRVRFDAQDLFGNPPAKNVIADEIIAEYLTGLDFFGERVITVQESLTYGDVNLNLETAVFGRNLPTS